MSAVESMKESPLAVEERMKEIYKVDRTLNVIPISRAIVNCVYNYYMTLQEIETELRKKRCFTYIIARMRDPSLGSDISIELPPGTKKTYQMFLSARPEEKALQELLVESASYEENFEKLRDTGFLFRK